jgi:hypothetical protein
VAFVLAFACFLFAGYLVFCAVAGLGQAHARDPRA